MEPGSRVQPVRVRASREFIRPQIDQAQIDQAQINQAQIDQAQIDQAQIDQAVPSVTSTVCGAPPSWM
jgi:hypothetical protein